MDFKTVILIVFAAIIVAGALLLKLKNNKSQKKGVYHNRQKLIQMSSQLADTPTSEGINKFILYCEKSNLRFDESTDINNELFAMWTDVNRDCTIATKEKTEFCNWLVNKGLPLSEKQKIIVDNYRDY